MIETSGHLPECHMRHGLAATSPCICPALRACEQRVREDEQRIYDNEGRDPFAAGVQAARDAVAALPQHWPNSPALHRGTALAAIDALKGEANG